MQVPYSLGLIPDGNRRWAKKHNVSFEEAYNAGVKKFIDFAEWCESFGVKNITVWAFSTENFNRPLAERRVLFSIYQRVANDKNIINRLHSNETRFKVIGNLDLLPSRLREALHNVEMETKRYKEKVINLLIAYGGRDDILHAAKALVSTLHNKIPRLSEAYFKHFLISAEVPDLDLVIRTSGEQRLSGFMPWQIAYSELYFSKKLWPDFTKRDLNMALQDYASRQRRFGR